jgi:hypothetical protein
MTTPLLAFIAHLKQPRSEHIIIRDELTDRGFPCVISNDLNSNKEYPNCSIATALEVSSNRSETILNPSNRFFIYFIDDVSEQGQIELGQALNVTEHIALIGPKRKLSYHFFTRCHHYDSWEQFISKHFFA